MAKPLGIEALKIEPIVGEWYRSKGEQFEVVAVDEDDGTIEIQYFDGTIEELDFDDWQVQCNEDPSEGLVLQPSEPPEDYSGAFEVEEEELLTRADDYDSGNGGLRASGLDGLDLFE